VVVRRSPAEQQAQPAPQPNLDMVARPAE
jgi:hypothetical protein